MIKFVKRLNNVKVKFAEDKANLTIEDCILRNFQSFDTNDDDYGYFDNISLFEVDENTFNELSYYLKDLSDISLIFDECINVINKIDNHLIEYPTFIINCSKYYLFLATYGYSYPRFKAFVDKSILKEIKK